MTSDVLGFKKLNLENWLLADPVCATQVQGGPDAWIRMVLKPRLSQDVPIDVRRLYEVAQGSLAYGFLFYPLLTLATEQVFRVGEAALREKCVEMGAASEMRFAQRIEWLAERGVISAIDQERWSGARELRNSTSHPGRQMILPPGAALSLFTRMADDINKLFSSGTPTASAGGPLHV